MLIKGSRKGNKNIKAKALLTLISLAFSFVFCATVNASENEAVPCFEPGAASENPEVVSSVVEQPAVDDQFTSAVRPPVPAKRLCLHQLIKTGRVQIVIPIAKETLLASHRSVESFEPKVDSENSKVVSSVAEQPESQCKSTPAAHKKTAIDCCILS